MIEQLQQQLRATQEYFERSTRCLDESDSGYAPDEVAMTVAQQVAHAAQTVDWFFEGAFRPEGFSLDFEGFDREVRAVESLVAAREWLSRAFEAARERLASSNMEELSQPLPEGPIMGGVPRLAIVGAIADHTAHHRGALSVYSRLLGKVAPMPYQDM